MYKLKNDKQIHRHGKNKAYIRQQGHLDSFAKICNIAIYVIPILLLAWLLIMFIHYIHIDNWHPIESGGQAIFCIFLVISVGTFRPWVLRITRSNMTQNDGSTT